MKGNKKGERKGGEKQQQVLGLIKLQFKLQVFQLSSFQGSV